MKKIIPLLTISVLVISCTSPAEQVSKQITAEGIMQHVEVLASDEYMGRSTGTDGEQMAADYIINEFKSLGATSGVEDGSFIQPFPLLGQKTDKNTSLRISGNSRQSFDYYNDFMAWPANQADEVRVRNADMVYVGYGIQAPEENWDDFKGVDVAGKVLIVKNNDPAYDDNMFGGDARLYYGRYTYKYEKALEKGALGVLIIHTTPTAGYGWNVVSNSWSRERFYLKSGDATEPAQTEFNGWLTYDASKQLFEQAGLDVDKMLDAADSPDFEPVALNGPKLNLSLDAEYRTINGKNVVGVIEGSDPELKDEYLVITGHYDHLGITTPIDGDDINNGAEDNAAGIAGIIEMAKGFKALQSGLKRSVILLAVSAEEVGLLGSKYWAENPTVPVNKVSANINLDGTNVYGATKDMVIVGYGRTTLSDMVVEAAAKVGRTVKPDANPSAGIFYRSDHFSLAKVGIPAIFPNPGNEFIGKPENYASVVDSVSGANYHTVNDEVNEYWDLSGAEADFRLLFKVAVDVLNDNKLQAWKAGDEFEAARLESLKN